MPTILGLPAAAASVVCHRRAGSGLRRCLAVREAVRSEPLESRKVWAQHRAAALGEIDIMAKRVGGVLKKSSPRGRSIQLFLECWLLGSLRTFCNFFLKITLKFSVLMLKSQLNTYFYKSE